MVLSEDGGAQLLAAPPALADAVLPAAVLSGESLFVLGAECTSVRSLEGDYPDCERGEALFAAYDLARKTWALLPPPEGFALLEGDPLPVGPGPNDSVSFLDRHTGVVHTYSPRTAQWSEQVLPGGGRACATGSTLVSFDPGAGSEKAVSVSSFVGGEPTAVELPDEPMRNPVGPKLFCGSDLFALYQPPYLGNGPRVEARMWVGQADGSSLVEVPLPKPGDATVSDTVFLLGERIVVTRPLSSDESPVAEVWVGSARGEDWQRRGAVPDGTLTPVGSGFVVSVPSEADGVALPVRLDLD